MHDLPRRRVVTPAAAGTGNGSEQTRGGMRAKAASIALRLLQAFQRLEHLVQLLLERLNPILIAPFAACHRLGSIDDPGLYRFLGSIFLTVRPFATTLADAPPDRRSSCEDTMTF